MSKASANSRKWRQYATAITINLSAVAAGLSIGWTSPMIGPLQDPNTPLGTEPMTQDQISWLTAIFCVAPVFALPFSNPLAEKYGRKIFASSISIPLGFSWLLTLLAKDFACLVIARILAGVGLGMVVFIVPIYVAEISSDEVRGVLGSFLMFALNIGILLGFIFGAAMSYQMFAISGLILAILFVSGFAFMPESPIYLLRKNCHDQATRSLMWIWNNDKTTVDSEIMRLQEIVKDGVNFDKKVRFKDLWRDRGTFRGFLIASALLSGQQTSGIAVVFMYTVTIFRLAGSSLDPDSAAIILAVMQVFGSFLSTMTIERAGRRLLLLISCLGMAISHCLLGLFLLLQHLEYDVKSINWFPVVVLSFYTILYCIGIGPVAYVVTPEVLSPDVSGLASSVAVAFMWIISFIIVKGFPLANDVIENYGCFFVLASCCLCTFVFTYFVVPETKGRSIESILKELGGEEIETRKIHENKKCSVKP
ncbi:facilitated trehalose transporter Tret1-like [Diachasmimorpha longicaudata]|uniref:facilitated trehalose transporter Tret1-like n=1 Tax=Diachasmimorpha longicaudata TaxID=58733 RepID=UPI0030B9060A